jgi:hypothetical protein
MKLAQRRALAIHSKFDDMGGDEQDYFESDDWQYIQPFAERAALA